MTNADVAWYVEQMWDMHPMILNKLEMMEHTLLAMEQCHKKRAFRPPVIQFG